MGDWNKNKLLLIISVVVNFKFYFYIFSMDLKYVVVFDINVIVNRCKGIFEFIYLYLVRGCFFDVNYLY